MIFPPSIMRLRVHTANRRIGLWLPLIILWPVVAVFALLLAPLVLLAAIILWPRSWGKPLLFAGPALFRLICALRGLELRIEEPTSKVLIWFI